MIERKFKILFLISHIGHGGDWSVVKTIAEKLPIDSTQLWLNGSRWIPTDRQVPEGPIRTSEGWRSYLKIRKTGNEVPKDLNIIHTHSPAAILAALILRWFQSPNAKIIFTYHWPTKEGFVRRFIKQVLINSADRIHCVSIDTKSILIERYRVSEGKCNLCYLGVDNSRFKPLRKGNYERDLVKFGWDNNNFVIGYMGRFDQEKNVSWLIRFIEQNAESFPQLRLLIYGGGALEEDLREQAGKLVERNLVNFAGYTKFPEQAYPLMDLHVLPSEFEAFALTVVEAALCGVPTLRTNVEGAKDQITDGLDGFVCDIKGGYVAFEKKLLQVLQIYRNDLERIGERSRVKLMALCDVNSFADNITNLYAEACDQD